MSSSSVIISPSSIPSNIISCLDPFSVILYGPFSLQYILVISVSYVSFSSSSDFSSFRAFVNSSSSVSSSSINVLLSELSFFSGLFSRVISPEIVPPLVFAHFNFSAASLKLILNPLLVANISIIFNVSLNLVNLGLSWYLIVHINVQIFCAFSSVLFITPEKFTRRISSNSFAVNPLNDSALVNFLYHLKNSINSSFSSVPFLTGKHLRQDKSSLLSVHPFV